MDEFLDAYDRVRVMADAARHELELDRSDPGAGHASRAAAYAALAVYERLEAIELLTEFDGEAYERLHAEVARVDPAGLDRRRWRSGPVRCVRTAGEWLEGSVGRLLGARSAMRDTRRRGR